MKGVKTMSLANATSKRFQSDDIIALRIHLPEGIEAGITFKKLIAENKNLNDNLDNLVNKVKELEDKLNSLETVEDV